MKKILVTAAFTLLFTLTALTQTKTEFDPSPLDGLAPANTPAKAPIYLIPLDARFSADATIAPEKDRFAGIDRKAFGLTPFVPQQIQTGTYNGVAYTPLSSLGATL